MTTELKAPGGASLVINRAKWLRGVGDGSMLRRPSDGKMCCLRFYGLSLGLNETEIASRGTPEETISNPWPSWLLGDTHRRTRACQMLMSANDSKTLSDADREHEIAAIFAEHGVTVTFIDDEASGNASVSEPSRPLETK